MRGHVEADGIFRAAPDSVVAGDFTKNRPIDVDNHRNQADFESPKFAFEIKIANL
jgi:hypothetical protein